MKLNKNIRLALGIIIVAATLVLVYSQASKQMAQSAAQTKAQTIDNIISDAIMTSNSEKYLKGECRAEGHVVLKTVEENGILTAYLVASYGEFGFENGIFTKISGSGAIPTVITFYIGKDKSFTLKEYKDPLDGSEFDASIRKMFPAELIAKVSSTDSYNDNLSKQQEDYAKKYLALIGREATVQEASVEKTLPDMNSQASNELLKQYSEYPYWVGNTEKIENGVRYVYQTDWKSEGNGDGTVAYTKSVYNGDVVEKTVISIKNGKMTYLQGSQKTFKS